MNARWLLRVVCWFIGISGARFSGGALSDTMAAIGAAEGGPVTC